MFQKFKRALFLSKNNFSHWDTGDLVRMHIWLQEIGWPANEFVDLFMRAHPNFDPIMHGIAFELFMCNQYDWNRFRDINALMSLFERVNTEKFKAVDKLGLVDMLNLKISAVKDYEENVVDVELKDISHEEKVKKEYSVDSFPERNGFLDKNSKQKITCNQCKRRFTPFKNTNICGACRQYNEYKKRNSSVSVDENPKIKPISSDNITFAVVSVACDICGKSFKTIRSKGLTVCPSCRNNDE